MSWLVRPPRAETLATFAKTYAWASVAFAFLLGVFESLFGWGIGALGAVLPAVIASNRAAEVFARRRRRAPDRPESWRMAIEMGVVAASVGLLLTAGLVVPLAALAGQWTVLVEAVGALAPGSLTATMMTAAAIVTIVVRLAWPWQVGQALGR